MAMRPRLPALQTTSDEGMRCLWRHTTSNPQYKHWGDAVQGDTDRDKVRIHRCRWRKICDKKVRGLLQETHHSLVHSNAQSPHDCSPWHFPNIIYINRYRRPEQRLLLAYTRVIVWCIDPSNGAPDPLEGSSHDSHCIRTYGHQMGVHSSGAPEDLATYTIFPPGYENNDIYTGHGRADEGRRCPAVPALS